mgnify:CR=1 FL=1
MRKLFQQNLVKNHRDNIQYLDKNIPLDGPDTAGFDKQIKHWFALYYGLFFLDYYKIKRSICIDIGVYKGLYSSIYARHFQHVYSFEASPYACLHAKSNFKRQKIPNITLHEVGILDFIGEATFDQKFTDKEKLYIRGSSSFNPKAHPRHNDPLLQIKVPVKTLDSYKINPSFLKIDAEATELKILHGAYKTITTNLPFIQIETNTADKLEIDKFLRDLGYKQIDLNNFSHIYSDTNAIEDSYYMYPD